MIEAWNPDDPWPNGCRELLIVGPPGTGKTRTVLDRYVWPVIEAGGIVLATSFTRAAAGELRDRTGARFGRDPSEYREALTTIHSEANRRCRHLGLRFSKRQAEKQATGAEGDGEMDWAAVLQRLEDKSETDFGRAWDFVRHVWPEDAGKNPRDRLARIVYGSQLALATAQVEMDLRARLDESGALVNPDFTGLLELALTQGSDKAVDLLAIDEAQDLSPLQWALMDRWATRARRVLVVGDPDQAIYGWAGADGKRLLSWIRAGRPCRRLAKSWRVPRLAHAIARDTIRLVIDREDAPYLPADRDGEVLRREPSEAWGLASSEQEAERSVLVLSRTVAGCGQAVSELLGDGIPHIAERGRRILDPHGKLLRIAAAAMAWAYRGSADLECARALVDALAAKGSVLRPEGARVVKAHVQATLRDYDRETVPWAWCEAAGLGPGLSVLRRQVDTPTSEWWAQALLASHVGDLDALLTVLDWLQVYGSRAALLDVAQKVVVTTAHGAKGREADLVVLDARASISFRQRVGSGAIEVQTIEERIAEDLRVLYVAITRTKGSLVVIRGFGKRPDWLSTHGITIGKIALYAHGD
jgi:hypothetical protein